jgi:UDP-N-acetylglucosamine 1-carboxyvinyltransferase
MSGSEYIEIHGGSVLNGTVKISGAKNAALPQLMAALLTSDECTFENVPNLEDVTLALHLLEHFGARVERETHSVKISVPRLIASEASYSLVKALRASFWVLSPLLARGGAARVALPGGDIIGARPVDIHLEGLTKMGAEITVKHGVVYATAPKALKGCEINFRFPSVGATHQLVMAASLAKGTTVLRNVAKEPEVVALCEMLLSMGADIDGAGTDTIVIRGKEDLSGAKIKLIGDRIEAGTYLLAAAVTKGAIRAEGVCPDHLGEFLNILEEMGLDISTESNAIILKSLGRMKGVDVVTGPFPSFATDLQAPLMAALCFAEGASSIEEHIFEGRFGHVSELCRMGADIKVSERTASINSAFSSKMSGAEVEGMDIRAAASLVVAAVGCSGTSMIHEPQHLRRGYEALENKLTGIGAKIGCRLRDPEDFVFSGC